MCSPLYPHSSKVALARILDGKKSISHQVLPNFKVEEPPLLINFYVGSPLGLPPPNIQKNAGAGAFQWPSPAKTCTW